jgi:hypothetical protein
MNERTVLSRGLIGVLLVDLALGLVLGYRLLSPPPVVVVPGVREEQVVVPGVVPDQSLANFALLFALNFENYSTATLESQDRYAQALVSSKFVAAFQKMTDERRAMIREALLASSFFPQLETVRVKDGVVSFQARKQHLIGDRLSWDALFAYEIAIERAAPTQLNPYGLAIARFHADKVGP